MDRCALFVDAGYVLGDGAMAVHGTRNRESVSWDYAGVLGVLTNVARDHTGLPLLRCYWYEATVEGRRSSDHETLAALPGVKLRLGRMKPGRREGVESEIHRDLTTLARNRAISDALVVSGDEDLVQVIADVQDLGLRVILVHIAAPGWAACTALQQECDDLVEISEAHLRPTVELVVGAEPLSDEERHAAGAYAARAPANGHGPPGVVGHRHALPAGSHAAPPPIYTGSLIAEYQRAAQPAISQAAPAASAPGPLGGASPAMAAEHGRGNPTVPGPMVMGPGPGPGMPGMPPAQPGMAAQPGMPPAQSENSAPRGPVSQPGTPGQPGAEAQPGVMYRPGAMAAPGMTAQTSLPGVQPGLAAPAAAMPGHYAPPGHHAAPGQPVMPPAEALPGRGGHHASPAPADSGPAGPGLHELSPQLAHQQFAPPPPPQPAPGQAVMGPPAPPGTPAMAQGYQAPAGVAGPQSQPPGPLRQGMPAYQAAPPAPPGFRAQGPDMASAQAPASPRPPAAGMPPGPVPGGPPAGQLPSVPPGQLRGVPRSLPPATPGQLPGGPLDQRMARQFPAAPPSQTDSAPYIPQQGPHSGPQPAAQHALVPQPVAVSLADAVQAAHGEGFNFGQGVARDAPALWLEAVLARKPRMPSDLEARLLQDSSLPIDSLLHDEVRHALRRGFWDALERVRH